MRIVHGLITVVIWVAVVFVGFFIGWNLRAYKARRGA